MKTSCLAVIAAALMMAACEDGSELDDGGGPASERGTDARDASDGSATETPLDRVLEAPDQAVPADVADEAIGTTDGADGVDTAGTTPPEALPADGGDATTADQPPESGNPPGDGPGGGTASRIVTVAEGGTLMLGEAMLLVPPQTLTGDRTLSVTVASPADGVPNRADILGDIYEFGPDGTSFVVPVPLTLPLVGPVPTGKQAVVAWLDEGAAHWVPVPSMVNGSTVTGFVTHFTSFAVLLVNSGGQTCLYGGACGGSLAGNWQYSAACISAMPPRMQACGSGMPIHQRQSFSVTGTLNITEGRYTMNRVTRVMATLFYTPACLEAINASQTVYADCAALQAGVRQAKNNMNWNCAGSIAQGCSCYLNTPLMPAEETGTVTVTGNKLRFTKDGAAEPGPEREFCVRDHHLSIKNDDGSVHSATKMP